MSKERLNEILKHNIGERFVFHDLGDKPENIFTIIGESQEENKLLVEYDDGTVDSLSPQEFDGMLGYELIHERDL